MRSVENSRPASTLVRGRWVFTGAGGGDPTLDEGAVLIEGGTVRQTGSFRSLKESHPQALVLGSDRYAVMPGLINSHQRSLGATTMQHGIEDAAVEAWSFTMARKRPADVYLATLASAAAMLRSGVTTVVEAYNGDGRADQYASRVSRSLDAYAQSGMRAAVAAGFKTSGFLVSGVGEDRRFLERLSPALQALALHRIPEGDAMGEDEYFGLMADLHQRYQRHSRVGLWFGAPGPQWVSDSFLQRSAALAEEWGIGLHTSVNETICEMLHGHQFYGASTMGHLERLEVLSERFSVANAAWLDRSEMEVIARNGVSVTHNPSANLRLGSGVAPVDAMLEHGINVALGTAGVTLNDDDDFFAELRLAQSLRGEPGTRPTLVSAKRNWQLATAGGSALFRRGGALGRLAPGAAADLVLIDLERITAPWVAPEVDPLELVLRRARVGDVHTVLVSGDVVLEHGNPTRFDDREVAGALADALTETPYEAAAAEVVDELLPHVLDWYDGQDTPSLQPWGRPKNSQ